MTSDREKSTWYQERDAEFRRLSAKREQIEGHEIYDALQMVAVSAYVFEKNHEELETFIKRCESYMPMVRIPAYRNQAFLIELSRYLHNHCAAAYSLQQHFDVFQKKISNDAFHKDLQSRFKEAGQDHCGRFFQSLRTYLQHYSVPPVASELRYKEAKGVPPLDPTQTLLLNADDLLKWNDWNPQARSFISESGGQIPLRESAKRHCELVLGVYSWLWNRVRDLHEDAFTRLDAIGIEMAALYDWQAPKP